MLKLHLAEIQDFSPEVKKRLGERFLLTTGSVQTGELRGLLQRVDVFWFRLGYRLDGGVLDEATRCRYLVSPVTGLDHIDEPLCARLGIRIIALRGEFDFLREVRATAEHTLLLALALMRKVVPAVCHTQQGGWERDLFRGWELYKKNVGIIGYGRLGKIVGDLFVAFGAEVGAYEVATTLLPEHIKRFSSLEDCIAGSDIISVHVPYKAQTHHLIDDAALTHFNENKWLINTSRGGVVDEAALLRVFEQGGIAGAAVDVLYGEPAVAEHPLIQYAKAHDNLIITPHIGGCTYESFEKTEAFVEDKLLRQIALDNG